MIKIGADQIIELIQKKTGMSGDEINAKIEQKLTQLSGLISREGAAHIVANELDIKVFEEITTSKGDIKSLVPGMRNIDVKAKIIQMYDPVNFNTNNRTGKVRSFRVSDGTGSVRVVLWNDLVDKYLTLAQGDVIRIQNAMVKKNQGFNELHILGSSLIEVVDEELNVERERKAIADLQDTDDNVEVMATIVQVYDPRYYEVCKTCGMRAKPQEGQFVCNRHGPTQTDFGMALNTMVDDGTSTVRAIFFQQQAARLMNKSLEEAVAMRDAPQTFDEAKRDLLGKTVLLTGKARKNIVLDNMEFIPRLVQEPNVQKEMEKLQQAKPAQPQAPVSASTPTPAASPAPSKPKDDSTDYSISADEDTVY